MGRWDVEVAKTQQVTLVGLLGDTIDFATLPPGSVKATGIS